METGLSVTVMRTNVIISITVVNKHNEVARSSYSLMLSYSVS